MHEADEELYADNVLAACERSNVRLVFAGVHVDTRWGWLRAQPPNSYGDYVNRVVAAGRTSAQELRRAG